MGRIGPDPSATTDAPAASCSSIGEDALGRLLDGHLEPGVQQRRDVSGYDGARRSVPRASDRIHTWTGCMRPGCHRRAGHGAAGTGTALRAR